MKEFHLSQTRTVPVSSHPNERQGYYTINDDGDGCFGSCDEMGNTDHLPHRKTFYEDRGITVWYALNLKDPSLFKGLTKEVDGVLLGKLTPNN